jgi:hypothetical protein
VKKLFAILLLFIYLISLTELSQLVKLPILVEHFIEHKEKNSNLSLWEFLNMHYAQSDDHDGDRDKDMKLPFKSHDGCINTTIVALPSTNIGTLSEKPICIEKKAYSIYTENFLSSSHLSSIWQPPKAC